MSWLVECLSNLYFCSDSFLAGVWVQKGIVGNLHFNENQMRHKNVSAAYHPVTPSETLLAGLCTRTVREYCTIDISTFQEN